MDPSAQQAAVPSLIEDEKLPLALRRLMAVTERIVVEQAKGVLEERFRVSPGEAFELLRGTARFRQTSVQDLARDVVADKETPASILAYIQKSLTE